MVVGIAEEQCHIAFHLGFLLADSHLMALVFHIGIVSLSQLQGIRFLFLVSASPHIVSSYASVHAEIGLVVEHLHLVVVFPALQTEEFRRDILLQVVIAVLM